MSQYFYQLYGLKLKSNLTIPHLIEIEESEIDTAIFFEQKDFKISNSVEIVYKSYGEAENGLPYLSVFKQPKNKEDFLIIRYNSGKLITYFVSNTSGSDLRIFYPPAKTLSDVQTYLLGPVIGCVLKLKSQICLHASVININGFAVALIGEKTAGKSTLVAALANKGFPVLSDDIAVLHKKNNQFHVQSGYPRLRLWQKSLQHFASVDVKNLEPVLSHIEKFYLPLSVNNRERWRFQVTPLPLKAVVYLAERNTNHQLNMTLCDPVNSFLHLKRNIYANYMSTSSLLGKEFKMLSSITQEVSIYELKRPDDINRLDNTVDLISKLP